VTTFNHFLDYEELISKIADFELVVTDRYHATIFAMLAGTPVVPIDSNTFKTRGLMDLAEYPLPVLPSDVDINELRKQLDYVIANQPELATRVADAATRLSSLAAISMQALHADWNPQSVLSSDE